MTLTNHALTGALIGALTHNPAIALPAALLSHFVCDALPHFGPGKQAKRYLKSALFAHTLLIDVLACIGLAVVLVVVKAPNWPLLVSCAFLATLPDLGWLPGYIRVRNGKQFIARHQPTWLRLAAGIQWFERPIGLVVEAAWCLGALILLRPFI